jgi:hypothetical protein
MVKKATNHFMTKPLFMTESAEIVSYDDSAFWAGWTSTKPRLAQKERAWGVLRREKQEVSLFNATSS